MLGVGGALGRRAPVGGLRPAARCARPSARRVAELAELRGVAPEQQPDRPVGDQPRAALRCRASARGGTCARGTTPASRASGCRACWPPPGCGPCRRTRRASCSVNGAAAVPRADRGGDVARRPSALAHRVLGGRRGRLLALCAGSGTAAASPIAHTSVGAAHRADRSTSIRPPPSSGSPSSRDHRVRLDARGPADGPRRHDLAGRERHRVGA